MNTHTAYTGKRDPINCPANQPKPTTNVPPITERFRELGATTGEWTAEYVGMTFGVTSYVVAKEIADAHNAALAAAWDKWQCAEKAFEAQRQQLAAERDRYERLWEISGQLSEEVAQLNVQLAAERENLAAGQVIAKRLFRVVEQLPDVKHNSPNFLQTIKELQDACKAIPTTVINDYVADQLAAERERPCSWCESERDEVLQQLAAEKLKVKQTEAGWLNDAEKLVAVKQQLAAEKTKVQTLEYAIGCMKVELAKVK